MNWEVPVRAFDDDSAVVIYWNEKELKAGEKREVGFSYGLGSVSSATGQLGLTVGGDFTPGGELTVVGLVSGPQPGQKLTLVLPEGFTFAEGEVAEKDVPPPQANAGNRPVPITWRVRSSRAGRFDLELRSGASSQKKKVNITQSTIF
jgi:hypothetical protein